MKSYSLKRPIDIAVSLSGLVVLAPVLAAIAVAVRIDSNGPILFKQERIGFARKPFVILKFRTMKHRDLKSVDQMSEQVLSAATDERITRVGSILRSTSLDELPQLMNILKGDMSLVGPRPIIREQLSAMSSEQGKRFEVRPGLTGLAQIKGRRSLDWFDQLARDAEYVQKISLKMDLKILRETVRVVFNRNGVYGDTGSNWRSYLQSTEETCAQPSESGTSKGPQA